MTAAVAAAAVAACGSDTGPSADDPRLVRAIYSPADAPRDGENYLAQVTVADGGIEADVLLRSDPGCNTVAAELQQTDTLLLVIQTTLTAGCQPLSEGTLVEALILGVPDAAPPFRIEWWHGDVVDTVFSGG